MDIGVDAETADLIREMRIRVGDEPRTFMRLNVMEGGK